MTDAQPAGTPAVGGDWGPHADTPAGRGLSAMIASDRLPHALLISGPNGVGKRDLAIRAAQALLCESGGREQGPCRSCRTCRRLHDPGQPALEPQHTDVEVVGPGSLCADANHDHRNTRTVGICVIRRIEHDANLAPFEADRRIIIIDPADALTADAADAFLKTLEEPPDGVHFILLTSQEAGLSETIRSRCRSISLAPLQIDSLETRLDEWTQTAGVDAPEQPERRAELLRLARGRPGWLQANLSAGDPVTLRAAQIDDAVRIANADRSERLNWSEQLAGRSATAQSVANVELILDAWTDWWRDLWLYLGKRSESLTHRSQMERIEQIAPMYDQQHITQFLEQIQRTRALIQQGVNARLALDVLLLAVPVARTSP
ncbi:MAG: DNA polymerase III subunit [Chloroflexi bacterium]|nr:DNA polymerase III subunit [Chloroflexota bacterium]MYD17903.1 DNA polymerase III subunit [Chloroflexota bacterium]